MGQFTKFQTTHTDELWSSPRQSPSPDSFYHGDDEDLSGDEEYSSVTEQIGLKRHIVRMFSEDASGTSAVAIDNKIEQAMDLVKSHLMIAVREEVEVLKEKISELMDKINQLEVENTILKSNMSPETLHQLQIQAQLQIAGTGAAANMITQPPPTQQPIQPAPTQQQQAPAAVQPAQPAVQPQPAPPATPANTTNGPLS